MFKLPLKPLKVTILVLLVGAVLMGPLIKGAQAQVRVSPSPFPVITANAGPHFFSGQDVVLTEDLTGDVYVAGRNVRIENTIDGDLLVVGGQVTITGTVTQNVRAAGGAVDIRGTVGRNVTTAGATITLDRQSQVNGSVVAAAGTSNFDGKVGGNIWLAGSDINLDGQFGQDVHFTGEKVAIAGETVIAGNVSGQTKEPATVADGAQIQGQRQLEVIQPKSVADQQATQKKSVEKTIAWVVLSFLMALVGGAVILALFSRVSQVVSAQALASPVASFAWGVAHLVLTPIMVVLLFITVLGLPLGLVLLLFYVLSLILGGWTAALALGRKLLPASELSYGRQLLQFALGLGIFKVLEFVPVIGWIVQAVALVIGAGAVITTIKNAVKMPKTEVVLKELEVAKAVVVAPTRKKSTKTKKRRSTRR